MESFTFQKDKFTYLNDEITKSSNNLELSNIHYEFGGDAKSPADGAVTLDILRAKRERVGGAAQDLMPTLRVLGLTHLEYHYEIKLNGTTRGLVTTLFGASATEVVTFTGVSSNDVMLDIDFPSYTKNVP